MQEALNLEAPPRAILRPTQDAKHGDFQINGAMALAKQLKKNPREIASPIAEAMLARDEVLEASVAGPGFINLRLDPKWVERLLASMLRDARDGVPEVEEKQTVVVDYSSPNIAKQMHVGHLRSTIIGAAICELLRFVGHDVIADNHIGDWGTQYGLLILGMREFGDQEALKRDAIVELERVYKIASAKKKEDEDFADRARAELAKLQKKDPDNYAMWEMFVETTRGVMDRVYDKLGVTFDHFLGESAYDDMLPAVVQQLKDAGIAREDNGAVCVFFNDDDIKNRLGKKFKKLGKQEVPFIIQKKDGAFLYSTSDIATVLYRREHFNSDRAVYVVDRRQGGHFQQLFAVMEILGEDMTLDHVGFGTVLGDDGKPLKTRDGGTVRLESLLDEAVERARNELEQRLADGKLRIAEHEMDEVSRAVGIGAVKYADLKQNRTSDYRFEWDKMISFSGNSGPYLQNQLVRTKSIFRKGEVELEGYEAPIALGHEREHSLARVMIKFPDVVHRAAALNEPHQIAEHLYDLAQAFSRFFTDCPVLKSEGETRASRLALTALTSQQLERGLRLLGIPVIDRM